MLCGETVTVDLLQSEGQPDQGKSLNLKFLGMTFHLMSGSFVWKKQ